MVALFFIDVVICVVLVELLLLLLIGDIVDEDGRLKFVGPEITKNIY